MRHPRTARRPRHRRASIAATSALLLLALAGAASAQNADAEFLFNEGVRFETAGTLAESCDAFEASNRIEPRAGTLIRLGQCREKQGRWVSAWSAYKDALTRVKDPVKKQLAEARIRALEPTLSYLTVSVPDDARIDGLVVTRNGARLDPALWNRAVPVDAGAYTISGSAPGHEAWQTTIEVAATGDKASVEVPRFKAIAALVPPPSGGEPRGAPRRVEAVAAAPVAPESESGSVSVSIAESPFTGRRKLALGLAGAGLVAVAGGVVLGLSAQGLEDDAFELCPDPEVTCAESSRAKELTGRASDRALYANVAYGAGAVVLAGAAVLWFTGAPSRAHRVSVTPQLGAGVAGAIARISF